MKRIVSLMVMAAAWLGTAWTQDAGVGEKFWPYVEPPKGMDLEIDVANKILFLRSKDLKDPYIITQKDKKTGMIEKYYAWADEVLWDDQNQRARATGNVRIKNEKYFIQTSEITYDKTTGMVVCPDVTKVVEQCQDGFTNFIKAERMEVMLGEKGVNSLKITKTIESRYHIPQGDSNLLMSGKELAGKSQAPQPGSTATPAPGPGKVPAPFSPGAPRKSSEPDL